MSKAGASVDWHDYGSFGLWVKGHISLAANSMNDIVSGHYRDYTDKPGEYFDKDIDYNTSLIAPSGIYPRIDDKVLEEE